MTFRYFAYGSNMWLPRMRSRCPSAKLIGVAILGEWVAVYDKPSTDGSAKLNIRPVVAGSVAGVVYQIDDRERGRLDAAEPSYRPIDTLHGLSYAYEGDPTTASPFDWYVEMVDAGRRSHGLAAQPGSRNGHAVGQPGL